MQPGRQQHARSQQPKPSLLQLQVPKETGKCVCFRAGVRYTTHRCKAVSFFRKQTYTRCEITMLQRSAIIMVLYFSASSTFHQDFFSSLLSFDCAAKSNITDYKTEQSLLLKLPRLLSLFAPSCDFLCLPLPPPSLPALFFYCCGTGCRGPTLMLLLDSCPLGPQSGPSLTININQRRCQ